MAPKPHGAGGSLVDAVQAVYTALDPLDGETRIKVLASVTALLGMSTPSIGVARQLNSSGEEVRQVPSSRSGSADRPKSIVELLQEKQPKSNPQKLALFAYYRERVEGLSRFSKSDLKGYFASAKEKPAANYDRDFSNAVKLGWIHEDGADSYLTSRGLEVVESGFAGAQPIQKRKLSPKRAKAKGGRKNR
jgi:hypothetical protein